MKLSRTAGWILMSAIFAICATAECADEPRGSRLLTSGHVTENGSYAEVGLEFSTWGDFIALVSPTRWKSPLGVGGSLSWLNPGAWNEDAGRTSRILLGEAVVVGGLAAAFGGGGGGGSSPTTSGESPGSSSSGGSTSTPTTPGGSPGGPPATPSGP